MIIYYEYEVEVCNLCVDSDARSVEYSIFAISIAQAEQLYIQRIKWWSWSISS